MSEPPETHAEAHAAALDLLHDLLGRAQRAGAEAADAVLFESASLSVSRRLGKLEVVERSESNDLGLRVFVGKRQAIVSSSDSSSAALDELVERSLAMARAAPEDRYCGLAEARCLARQIADLDLDDALEPREEALEERAARAEDAALAVPGVNNSEGAEASWGRTTVALATSTGFAGAHTRSSHGVVAAVLAGEGTAMERDYDYASARHGADLEDPEVIGRRAGERAVRRLGPRKVASARVPVVFDPRVSAGLMRHLASAINGAAVARGTSFLKERMGEEIFAPGIDIVDDPLRPRGLNSKPFDGEGVAPERRKVIDDGRLTTWLLDSASGRQLELATTGHASRGTSAPPGPAPTNFYLEAGAVTTDELMADIDQGFYVTELAGFGINMVTGDYSRGASGFWIENGALSYPVSEVTVAGNLKDMFRALVPADDLVFRYGVNAPTLRIDGMTVGGA
ncbi:MAG: TldD/PmbA family protein [Alphaproteobacteria bacterium]|nr:TldD/PmbA family protein [Alphaproteobacteria bacterium]